MENIQLMSLLENINPSGKKYQKFVSWSWEMLGTLMIMMNVNEIKNVFCLRKKSSDDEDEECQEKEFTLVLDLDETLIHSDTERSSPNDKEIIVKLGKTIEKYYVKIRPYVKEFLQKMAEIFELVIFTASIKEYADQIIDYIDPTGLIKRRFYRDSCTKKDGNYYKDISKINGNLDKVCIVDNSISGLCMNYDNGLLIKSWYNDQKDQELKTYASFLSKFVKPSSDFRHVIQYLKKRYPKSILN